MAYEDSIKCALNFTAAPASRVVSCNDDGDNSPEEGRHNFLRFLREHGYLLIFGGVKTAGNFIKVLHFTSALLFRQ